MLSVLISSNLEEGCSCEVDVGGLVVSMSSYTKTLDICYDFFLAIFNLIVVYPLLGEEVPSGDRRCYCWVGRWYVHIGCQYKPLYLAPIGRNLRYKFWLGCMGKGWRYVGRWRWVPWLARRWLPTGSLVTCLSLFSQCSDLSQMDGRTDRTDGIGLAKRHYALKCIGRQKNPRQNRRFLQRIHGPRVNNKD